MSNGIPCLLRNIQPAQESGIEERSFVLIFQTIQTHILVFSGRFRIVKCWQQVLLSGYSTPFIGGGFCRITICRKAIFKSMSTILHDIFRNITKVQIKLSSCGIVLVENPIKHSTIFSFDKWIQHPEFYVFYIGSVKVYLSCDSSCHTSVILFGVWEQSIKSQVGIVVIHSSLTWEVCHFK